MIVLLRRNGPPAREKNWSLTTL